MSKMPTDFEDKAYRDAFTSAGVSNRLAFQIFAMREQRGWSQEMLATKADTVQPVVSRWEKPGHKFTLATLKKIASAFDVGLVVGFVPLSQLAKWHAGIRPGTLEVPSYEDEKQAEELAENFDASEPSATSVGVTAQFVPGPQMELPMLRPVLTRAAQSRQTEPGSRLAETRQEMRLVG
jgi:transcriptional regulator with XRE-family HTH domain